MSNRVMARLVVLAAMLGSTVDVLDRHHEGITSHRELRAYGAEHGPVPVTEFTVHDVSAVELVCESFARLSIQLRIWSLENLEGR